MKKKAVFLLPILACAIYVTGCAGLQTALELAQALDTLGSFSDAAAERIDSEDKILIFLENRTNELLVVFVQSLNERAEAELARLAPHSVNDIRISRERVIRIVGGNSGATYGKLLCDYDGLSYIVYPLTY